MTTQNKKGFTIIEVVLVLAIAGLIFLMVFIALPALQRSQRNTQRSDDLSRFLTAANSFQSNNNGKTPFKKGEGGSKYVDDNFVTRYIDSSCKKDSTDNTGVSYTCTDGSEFTDPDGNVYKMKYMGDVTADTVNVASVTTGTGTNQTTTNLTWESSDHTILVYTNASCGDEGTAVKGTGERQYAMFYVLEGGAVACNDNH